MGPRDGSTLAQEEVVLGSRYRLRRRLASSGHSSVHLALDTATDTLVAVKYADDPDHIPHLRGERRALDEVRDPHIVDLLDWGRCGAAEYLVLELAGGGTLSRRVDERRADPESTLRIGMALAKSLEAVHRHGYVHRDVKCSNMLIVGSAPTGDLVPSLAEPGIELLRQDERVVLCDFGVAYPLDDGLDSPDQVGTMGFRAPEQWTAEPSLSPAVDIYAATAVILSVVSGDTPPEGDELRALVALLRPEWREFVERGMHPSPDQRHASMAMWAEHLRRVIEV